MSAIERRLIKALDDGETVAIVNLVESGGTGSRGARIVVPDVGDTVGTLGDAALDDIAIQRARAVIEGGKSGAWQGRSADGQPVRLYVELVESPPWLLIVGAGHVAKPTATLGKLIGFKVTVLDDRPEFANEERYPEADEVIAADFRLTLERLLPEIHRQTYIVLVTRGHRQDEMALRTVIGSRAAYIGMIGSRRRSRMVLDSMISDGYPRERVAAVRSPIGLDLQAETPEEIAVAIIGEIIAVRRGGTARTLSARSVLRRQQEVVSGP